MCEDCYVRDGLCHPLCDTPKAAILEEAVLVFLRPQLAEMCVDILGDNEGAMAVANNPSNALRSKHIDVKFQSIQGLAHAGEIRILHVGTEGQHADILTKMLWRKKFMVRCAALMNLA